MDVSVAMPGDNSRLDTFEALGQILRLNTGIAQRDNAAMFELLGRIHPIDVVGFESGREHNGWVVPYHTEVKKADIWKGDERLFDGTCHPLALVGASGSFTGTLSKQELDRHVFYSKEYPDAFLYHPMNVLRPWQSRWGFCIPYNEYKSWPAGDYRIELETERVPSKMLVGTCFHQGASDETIVFNAHTCHPCQVNDGLAGAGLILELFNNLQGRKSRYSYLGVLAPEILGTAFYLADIDEQRLKNLKLGIFIESIGSRTPLALQYSFTGQSVIDEMSEYVLRSVDPQLRTGRFRTVVGNDETVWEAPGIEVPMVSITRHPFPHYHTTEDNVANLSRAHFDEALQVCERIITLLEEDQTIERKFRGLVALSNPRLDLYRQRANPTLQYGLNDLDQRWGILQDYLPRYFDGKHSLFHIARAAGVPFEELVGYMRKFEDKGLVALHPVESINSYARFVRPQGLPGIQT